MWIERLNIAGFGRLEGEFELGEGLTVVCGPNEAGKSTLHDALLRSMFGFGDKERHRRRNVGGSVMLDRAPWIGDRFGLVAHMHLAGDRPLRIEWAFGPEREQRLTLRDAHSGEDLTRHVAAKGGDYTLGDYLLGIDLGEYRQWSCLEQASGGAVRGERGLVDALRNASETGSENAGVDIAQELIANKRRSNSIGVHGRTGKPLEDRAYALTIARRDELTEWIRSAEDVQAELAAEARELERIEAGEKDVGGRMAALEQERLLARRAKLSRTLQSAREAAEKARWKSPEPVPEIPLDAAREVRSLHSRIEDLQAERAGAEARQRASEGELSKLLANLSAFDAEIQALAAYESVDVSAEAEVGTLLGRLAEREQAAVAVAAEGADGIEGTEGSVEPSPMPGPPPTDTGSPLTWGLPLVIGLASVVGGAVVSPALFAGVLVAVAVYLWMRRQGAGEASFQARAEAEREAAALARVRAEQEAHERARQGAVARVEELKVELAAVLDALNVGPGAPRERAESYLGACRNAERLADLRSRRAGLAEQSRTLNEPVAEIQKADGELVVRRARIEELLHSFGISGSGAEAIAELDRLERLASDGRDGRVAAEQAAQALETILGGRTLEDVEAALREVDSELDGHRARHGAIDVTPREEAEVTADLDAIAAARTAGANRLGTAKQKVADLEKRLSDLPSWRAELEETKEKIERIEFAIEALAIADEQLAEAAKEAHRRSVPGLNRAINAELPRITDGRYTEATVDEDLAITLVAPETNNAVPAGRLSKGTQDQIYLVERLAILELLSGAATEPPPLLLDDAFAHFDHDRRRAALELLAEKAEERQIVLFVDEPEVGEELEGLGVGFGSIDLSLSAAYR